MTIRNLLRSLRTLTPRTQFLSRPLRKKVRRGMHSIPAESLENRVLLAATLFVDWGDNFPGGTLSTTLGGLRDVYNDADDTQDILGPELESTAGYLPGTSLDIVRQTFSAADRAAMMATVVRAYLPLDVHVVDLTATLQTTPDGRSVAAASSMADVINTLRSGPAGSKDAYVFVGRFVADPGGPNQKIYGPSGGGTSPVSGLDTSDLNAAANIHDDVAVVFTDSSFGYNFNTMNNIAHEAGHNFGLQHSLTNPSGNAATDLLHLSEVTSYLNTNSTTSSIAFSRYPMIRGDGNSPSPGVLNDYNDLEARTGDRTPWDQLATDPHVGPNPLYTFVSGTGAHDLIEITRSGAGANVRVTAYADAARTTPIIVPFAGGTSWTYSIPLTQTILVFAGASNDQIRITGDLGVQVLVDGMLGTDELIIDTAAGLAATWTPSVVAPSGIDQTNYFGGAPVLSYGGTITWGSTFVSLQNFEPTGGISFLNTLQVTVNGSPAADQFTVDYSGPEVEVSGAVAGTPIIPVSALNPTPILINGSLGSDTLTWNATGSKSITGPGDGTLSAPPLSPISFTSMELVQPGLGGSLSDVLNLTAPSLIALGSQDNQPNQIIVQRDSTGAFLEVLIDFDTLSGPGPILFSTQPFNGVTSLAIVGSTDSDLLTVNHANGMVQKIITFSGGAPVNSGEPNGDALSVTGAPAA
ncbi:MAG: reprolysin-like metallopeptidase, partial [Planctomycetota bacterium]